MTSFQTEFPAGVAEMAQECQERGPWYVARRIQDLLNRERRAINGSHVLLLGVTCGPADVGDSPAGEVAAALLALGAIVRYADPFVETWTVRSRSIPRATALREAVREAHVTVLLHQHRAFDVGVLRSAKLLLDGHGAVLDTDRL